MTFTATGSGTFDYRVVIDGCPYQAVTNRASMADASLSIGGRAAGLRMKDVSFSEKADPIACKLDVGGLSIQLVDVSSGGIDNVWSTVFDLQPTSTTWLAADCDKADVTITVASTAEFSAPGYAWIDGETFSYTGVTGTTFTGCTRGVLSDDTDAAQTHYITDGVSRRYPTITNWPLVWEGRRVVVYRYDETQSRTGAGTPVYRGVISTAPSFDGMTWTIGVDHAASLLEQTFGSDLATSLGPRGIHYTTTAPFQLNWWQYEVSGTSHINNRSGSAVVSGFFETQDDFCTGASGLTAAIAASFAANGGTGTMVAQAEGAAGWHLKYTTDAVTAAECFVQIVMLWRFPDGSTLPGSPLDPPLGALEGPAAPTVPGPAPVPSGGIGFPQNAGGFPQGADFGRPLVIGTDYYFYRPMTTDATTHVVSSVDTPLGRVPRGNLDTYSPVDADRTLYLGSGATLPSDVTAVMIKSTDIFGNDTNSMAYVSSVDTSARSVTVVPYTPGSVIWTAETAPEIRLGLTMSATAAPAGSSIADVLDYIALNSPNYTTLGVLPSLRSEDYDSSAWHDMFDTLPPINSQRVFTTFSPVSLADIVREELKAAACFLALNTTGQLIPARIRMAAASEVPAIATIDVDRLLTDKARVSRQVNGLGLVNQVTYKTGFNPESGSFDGDTFIARDVTAFGLSSSVRSMEIAQHSTYVGGDPIDDGMVLQLAAPISGALGGSYAVDTIDAAKSDGVALGDALAFDCPYVLTGTSSAGVIPRGQLGVLDRTGICIGKEWGAYSPRIRFTVINTPQLIGGYAPAGFVTAQTNTSGNTWSLTIGSDYWPHGTDMTDFFSVGDAVQVLKFNSGSASPLLGTVAALVTTAIVSVTFVGAWTPGADTWYFTIATGADIVARQRKYCIIGDSVGGSQTPVFGS